MRQVQFDRSLRLCDRAQLRTIVANTGLLDDTWFHRQNWLLGGPIRVNAHAHPGRLGSKPSNPNVVGMGKLIAFDPDRAFAVQNPYSWLKTSGGVHRTYHEGHFHQKYSRYKAEFFPVGTQICSWRNERPKAPAGRPRARRGRPPSSANRPWALRSKLQARAMVLARDVLFMAGWLDAVCARSRPPMARPWPSGNSTASRSSTAWPRPTAGFSSR